jgi:hypothetical protein
MAEENTWGSIRRHGLLSTSALLDLFEVDGPRRIAIESRHRPECVKITHPIHGSAVIRDQKPMTDSGLLRCLDSMKPSEWYRLLNRRVFFWLTEPRLTTLLQAKAYRDRQHSVLIVDTKRLVEAHSAAITLSPMNSGCTKPFPFPRGRRTFLPIKDYPFETWRKKRGGKDPIVELAVDYAIPKIHKYVLEVWQMVAGQKTEQLWPKNAP